MGRFPLPPVLTPHQRSLDSPPPVLPHQGTRPPLPRLLKCGDRAARSRGPARPRCCVSLSAGSAPCTAWKVTWRWDWPAPPHSSSPQSTMRFPSPLTSTKSNMSSSARPNRSRQRDSTGLQARAPIARIRTLAWPLHPAADPAPPPPSAAAP